MTLAANERPNFSERLKRNARSLMISYLTLMPAGCIAIAVIARHTAPYSQIPFWLLVVLALIYGASFAGLLGYFMPHVLIWLFPGEPDPKTARASLTALFILAILVTWAGWRDEPTNEQIMAIHNDPRFAAAIEEMHEKHINSFLLMHAMERGPSLINRYAVFAIEAVGILIGLGFLLLTHRIIFRILSVIFRIKNKDTARLPK